MELERDETEKLLKFLIERGKVCEASCNSTHIMACINQMRGAIWLVSGSDIGSDFDDLEDVAKFLGLEYAKTGDTITFKDFPEL